MFVTSEQLRNAIAIMRTIDFHELRAAAGHHVTVPEWVSFRDNPYQFFLRAPVPMRQAITDIINTRISQNV